MKGYKNDAGKRRWTLLPWDAAAVVVDVLEHGSRKYFDDNWRLVVAAPGGPSRYLDAALRHIAAYLDGEETDPGSGLPHLAHACCCLLFVLSASSRGRAT